jgi:hypothetical protein
VPGYGALPALQGPVVGADGPRAIVTERLEAAQGLFLVGGAAGSGPRGAHQEEEGDEQKGQDD